MPNDQRSATGTTLRPRFLRRSTIGHLKVESEPSWLATCSATNSNSNPVSAGSGGYSRCDEAPQRTLLLVVDRRSIEARAAAIRRDLSACLRPSGDRGCAVGVDCGQIHYSVWAPKAPARAAGDPLWSTQLAQARRPVPRVGPRDEGASHGGTLAHDDVLSHAESVVDQRASLLSGHHWPCNDLMRLLFEDVAPRNPVRKDADTNFIFLHGVFSAMGETSHWEHSFLSIC